jgi:hypothetical protein
MGEQDEHEGECWSPPLVRLQVDSSRRGEFGRLAEWNNKCGSSPSTASSVDRWRISGLCIFVMIASSAVACEVASCSLRARMAMMPAAVRGRDARAAICARVGRV